MKTIALMFLGLALVGQSFAQKLQTTLQSMNDMLDADRVVANRVEITAITAQGCLVSFHWFSKERQKVTIPDGEEIEDATVASLAKVESVKALSLPDDIKNGNRTAVYFLGSPGTGMLIFKEEDHAKKFVTAMRNAVTLCGGTLKKDRAFDWQVKDSTGEIGANWIGMMGGLNTFRMEERALEKDQSIPVIVFKRMSYGSCADAKPSDAWGCFVPDTWTIYISPRILHYSQEVFGSFTPGHSRWMKELLTTVAHEVGHARQARLGLLKDPHFCDLSKPHDERACEKDAELFAQWAWEDYETTPY